MNKIFLIIISVFLLNASAHAKDSTCVNKPYEHKVKKAWIWSACLPGAGQFYNEVGYRKVANKKHRAWWKIPIIYGGLGITGFYWYDNYLTAKLFKEEILFRRENGANSNLHPELSGYFSESTLISDFDIYAQRRDMFIFIFAGVWGLNVVEALVDAHFVTFDVSPDLSFNYYPVMMDWKTPGVGLSLTFN